MIYASDSKLFKEPKTESTGNLNIWWSTSSLLYVTCTWIGKCAMGGTPKAWHPVIHWMCECSGLFIMEIWWTTHQVDHQMFISVCPPPALHPVVHYRCSYIWWTTSGPLVVIWMQLHMVDHWMYKSSVNVLYIDQCGSWILVSEAELYRNLFPQGKMYSSKIGYYPLVYLYLLLCSMLCIMKINSVQYDFNAKAGSWFIEHWTTFW